ncbi:MAG: purine-nucleoside phosphorylase [Cytophagales bacterium]|nr:purine-nucleoside phosphorylase [Cytophagales bacterium]
MNLQEKLKKASEYVRSRSKIQARIGLVLGTGMNQLPESLHQRIEIPYEDIPHLSLKKQSFHQGKLYIGKLNNPQKQPVLIFQGRLHHYEGYSMEDIVFPIRLAYKLGVQGLIMTNAAGSLVPSLPPGDVMLASDHINLIPDSPVRGEESPSLGSRFVDLAEAYNTQWRKILKKKALGLKLNLSEGVYVGVPGPHLETQAEYRYLAQIGGQAVGMSTIPEVIAARQLNMNCAMLSVISDAGYQVPLKPIIIEDILNRVQKVEPQLNQLILNSLPELEKNLNPKT